MIYQCPDCGHTQDVQYINLLIQLGRAFRGRNGHSIACPNGCGLMIRVERKKEQKV